MPQVSTRGAWARLGRYPDVQYVATAAISSLSDSTHFDLAGNTLAANDRALFPYAGTYCGIYVWNGSAWALDQNFTAVEGATVRVMRSSGSPTYRQTATTGNATPVFILNDSRKVAFKTSDLWHNTCPYTPTANYNYGGPLCLPFSELRIETDATQLIINRSTGAVAYAGMEVFSVCVDGVWTDYLNNVADPLIVSTSNANATRRVIIRNGPGEAKAALIGSNNPTIAHNELLSLSANGNVTILPPVSPAVRLLTVGDSVTQGYGTTGQTRYSWTMLARDAYDGKVAVSNYGGSGMSLMGATNLNGANSLAAERKQLAKNICACLDGTLTNIIWLDFMVNDYLAISGHAWASAAAFAAALGDLIDQIHAIAPSAIIYYASTHTLTTEGTIGTWRTAAAAECALRSAYVTYIDGPTRIAAALNGDGIHPSTAGQYSKFQCVSGILGLADYAPVSNPVLELAANANLLTKNGSSQVTWAKNGAGTGSDFTGTAATSLAYNATGAPNNYPSLDSLIAGPRSMVSGAVSTSFPYTTWIVAKVAASAGTNQYVVDGGSLNQHAFYVQTGTDHWFFYAGTNLDCGARDANWHVWQIDHIDATHTTVYRDGTQVATGNAGSALTTALTVGAGYGGATPSTANIADVYVTTGTPSAGDKAWIKHWYLGRLGITTAY